MDFFDRIYWDNSVKSYLIVGGAILLMLLLKRYLSRYIASLLYKLVNRIWKNIEKKSFTDLVVEPLEWFLLILISVFAIDKLNFPTQWDYQLYGHSSEEILSRLGIGIIILSFTGLLLRIIDFIALVLEKKASIANDKSHDQLILFFRDFLKVLIIVAGILMIVKACFNQPIGNLLTGLSIVGAALALAAKESLENLIASFIIFFDKPFFTGDTLKVQNITGTVERIGLRSTRIRTADKTLVTVPNKQMVDSFVDNYSMRTQRRAELKLELSAKTNLEQTKQFIAGLERILETSGENIESSTVFFKEINKNSIVIVTEYFTGPITMKEYDLLKHGINLRIKLLAEESKVEFSGDASTSVYINPQ
ncbi:MAG: mechanosensitive ion channel domain-containing protein [Ferruginibacter sp.]